MAAAEPADPPKKSTYEEYAAILARERASTFDSSALDKVPEIPPPTSAAKPAGTRAWKCQGPSRAAVAAAVEKEYGPGTMVGTGPTTVRVTVSAEGKPTSVSIVSGGELGYGAAAQRCAMRQRYEPGHDEAGHAIASTTPPIWVVLSEH